LRVGRDLTDVTGPREPPTIAMSADGVNAAGRGIRSPHWAARL
jgi:hypothetical protein